MKSLREPLFHFLLIGAVLFGIYRWMNGAEQGGVNTIVITKEQLTALKDGFAYTHHRPPSAPELDTLLRNDMRSEVLVREARALGLDQEDGIIRERLMEKMRFVLGDSLDRAVDRMSSRYTMVIEP